MKNTYIIILLFTCKCAFTQNVQDNFWDKIVLLKNSSKPFNFQDTIVSFSQLISNNNVLAIPSHVAFANDYLFFEKNNIQIDSFLKIQVRAKISSECKANEKHLFFSIFFKDTLLNNRHITLNDSSKKSSPLDNYLENLQTKKYSPIVNVSAATIADMNKLNLQEWHTYEIVIKKENTNVIIDSNFVFKQTHFIKKTSWVVDLNFEIKQLSLGAYNNLLIDEMKLYNGSKILFNYKSNL